MPLTIITVCQNDDFGWGELGAQLPPHGHTKADVEALLILVEGVINDKDAADFFTLILVEAQHGGVILRSGDVVGVRQDSAGYGAGRCAWRIVEADIMICHLVSTEMTS